MRRLNAGLMLSSILALASCRTSRPPLIDICILDGIGGADCVLKDGSKASLLPSQLKNYWSTPEPDIAAFSSWCYKTDLGTTQAIMDKIKATATGIDGSER